MRRYTWIAIAAVLGVALLLIADAEDSTGPRPPPTGTSQVGPVGPSARAAASDVDLPGDPPPPARRDVDFARPEPVARAYLEAAHSLRAADRGRTNRRVVPYLAPANVAYPRGLVVTDEPDDGETVARIRELMVVGSDPERGTIAYRAELAVEGGATPGSVVTFVVLHRTDDGRWLVAQETSAVQPGD